MSREPYSRVTTFSTDNDPEKPILEDEKNQARGTVRSRNSSCSSLGLSIKTPRTARFAEATSVNSPIGPTAAGRSPFADPPQTRHMMPQPQPSDVGFGYVSDNQPSKHASFAGVEIPLTPASPLKSALKVPGTPGRLNPLSPTFREEQVVEKQEVDTEKRNAADLVRYPCGLGKSSRLTLRLESQNSSPNGQNGSTRRQLQLQSHRPIHDLHHLLHI